MAIEAITYVWETADVRGSALLLMLALADFANERGQCYPGVSRLAKMARMTERHARRTLQKLEQDGLITIAVGEGIHTKNGATNLYTLVGFAGGTRVSQGTSRTRRGDMHAPSPTRGGVTPVSPDPSVYDPSVDPSVSPQHDLQAGDSSPSEPSGILPPGSAAPPNQTTALKNAFAVLCYGTEAAWRAAKLKTAMSAGLRDLLALEPALTEQQMREFYRWWSANDWRGQKGQRPQPHLVPSVWLAFKESKHEAHQPGGEQPAEPVKHRVARPIRYPPPDD